MFFSTLILLLSVLLAGGICASPPCSHQLSTRQWAVGQLVNTTNGPAHGHAASNLAEVCEYLGIPYAQPPVGNLPFQSPTIYLGDVAINGSEFGSSCLASIFFVKDPFDGLTSYGWPRYLTNESTVFRLAYNNQTGPNLAVGNNHDANCQATPVDFSPNTTSAASYSTSTSRPITLTRTVVAPSTTATQTEVTSVTIVTAPASPTTPVTASRIAAGNEGTGRWPAIRTIGIFVLVFCVLR